MDAVPSLDILGDGREGFALASRGASGARGFVGDAAFIVDWRGFCRRCLRFLLYWEFWEVVRSECVLVFGVVWCCCIYSRWALEPLAPTIHTRSVTSRERGSGQVRPGTSRDSWGLGRLAAPALALHYSGYGRWWLGRGKLGLCDICIYSALDALIDVFLHQ
jgi:hypothetical protein